MAAMFAQGTPEKRVAVLDAAAAVDVEAVEAVADAIVEWAVV